MTTAVAQFGAVRLCSVLWRSLLAVGGVLAGPRPWVCTRWSIFRVVGTVAT